MACSCANHTEEYAHQVHELLGSVGLNEIVDQGREAIAEAGRALAYLNRSERATSLGFEAALAKVPREAAERSNRRAREQAQAVIARIDDRRKQPDWAANVERVRAGFKEHGGAQKLADLRADIRLRLLEEDPGLDATVAELAIAVLDGASKAAAGGDLNNLVTHMRTTMDDAMRGFDSPDMGRQWMDLNAPGGRTGGGPPVRGGQDVKGWCVAFYACLAWAYSSLIASLIVCFAVPFCWCCFHLAAMGTFIVHQLLCIAAFSGACRAQGG